MDWNNLMDLTSCSNMNRQMDIISYFISFCVDSIVPTKTVTIFPNNKPWILHSHCEHHYHKQKQIMHTLNPDVSASH